MRPVATWILLFYQLTLSFYDPTMHSRTGFTAEKSSLTNCKEDFSQRFSFHFLHILKQGEW